MINPFIPIFNTLSQSTFQERGDPQRQRWGHVVKLQIGHIQILLDATGLLFNLQRNGCRTIEEFSSTLMV
jgi:hypothetical protein